MLLKYYFIAVKIGFSIMIIALASYLPFMPASVLNMLLKCTRFLLESNRSEKLKILLSSLLVQINRMEVQSSAEDF